MQPDFFPFVGLELLLKEHSKLIKGRKIGLLAHSASVNAKLIHGADLLNVAGVDIKCLFGPEHGIRGEAQDMIPVETVHDPRLGVPVYSLYGQKLQSLKPSPQVLANLEVVIIDLQDIGSRYYTYVWTMVLMMEACAQVGIPVIILDRPNPINGIDIEGPSIEPGYHSFVGLHSLPVRHGLTLGEIARLVVKERKIEVQLDIIKVQGWSRHLYFDQMDLPWVMPSPNMPTLETAIVYPGACLFEGTNISEGRGTTRPFEIIGAPWIDGWQLAIALMEEDLPGVLFRPLTFRPTFHKYMHQCCGGIQIHVTDRNRYRPWRTGITILHHVNRLWPDSFAWRDQPYEFVTEHPAIDLLAGGPWLRQGIQDKVPLSELMRYGEPEEKSFLERRQPFLLY